ncbi:hypothetical protein Syun_007231 [Stephania yunnanensis]|uniref:Uncharacterized protein n=1 Tax=Stephania yunnanensis TaxID=152371 RepID=A0AAP0L0Q7_9MAGN
MHLWSQSSGAQGRDRWELRWELKEGIGGRKRKKKEEGDTRQCCVPQILSPMQFLFSSNCCWIFSRCVLLISFCHINMQTASATHDLPRYLKKLEENKVKNDKERLDDYYKRNYKDYFEFIEGSLKANIELFKSEKGILNWLQSNKKLVHHSIHI